MTKTCIAVIAACLVCPPAFAQHDAHGGGALSAEQVGTVDFQTSCAPAVKADMNLAVALLHSFWFPEARQDFEAIAAKDPSCAMAHWGVALTYWGNPFGGLRTPETIATGKAAIEKAQATGTPTRREKGYIDAVAGLFVERRRHHPARARGGLRGDHGPDFEGQPRRHRGPHLLGALRRPDRHPHRQDLRGESARGRDPRAALQEDAGASRGGALHHPRLRRAPARPTRARRGPPLRLDRAGRAARPPHAVAHLHPRRLLEGVDRDQPQSAEAARKAAGPPVPARNCTRSTTRPTPTCSWPTTLRPRACATTR